jgi:two-component system sensor histidine kinase VicK
MMILDIKKQGLELIIDIEKQLPEIMGDKSRIEQVLINIVSNAVRYTPEGGKITISAGASGSNIWIKVSDTGVGIPKEDIPRLFDRFYRVDKARTRAYGGTGLGLSIAHEIITKHGGSIQVESELDKGTDFIILLPIEGR